MLTKTRHQYWDTDMLHLLELMAMETHTVKLPVHTVYADVNARGGWECYSCMARCLIAAADIKDQVQAEAFFSPPYITNFFNLFSIEIKVKKNLKKEMN